ncbi:helix-turn-helix transcriptional regulator [Streptomyces sp. NBC_00102]|uniref:helix-turn-helix transcriptional regulator n=1 Tax=Streptomyces sp. NBC_00102 TaxID=2975652 RepID=UPI0022585439|nr:helix-turn-helix transcriptional regulator [Streptomyces sp. NBC_00102]MCX5398978.1 helix-turn-helix transcriptional regulator [Streptomyces sp. NBC_00102]
MDESELAVLGVQPLDETVYRALLRRPGATAEDLCPALRLGEHELQLALKRLDQQGMVHIGAGGEAFPVDPGIGVGKLAEQRIRALQEEQREILSTSHSLVRQVLHWQGKEGVHEEVETLEGSGLVYERVGELAYFARHELLAMQPSRTLTPECAAMARESDLRCLRRGVAVRALVHRAALQDPVSTSYYRELAAHGAQLRLLDGAFERVLIFDRSTALVESAPEAPDQRALLIRQEGLVKTLRSFFDRSWSHAADAAPLLVGDVEQERLEELQLKVLQIMARTDKDEAGARELGISVRTYRGHVARLLHRLNAATRFQAALLARDKGWI